MVPKFGAVWAIDIGNNSLKALHLASAGEAVEVIGFDNIQHGKVLTGAGVRAQTLPSRAVHVGLQAWACEDKPKLGLQAPG